MKDQPEQRSFGLRLHSAILNRGLPLSPTKLSIIFNRSSSEKITIAGVRKWLRGEAIPAQPKLAALAELTGTHPAWLRFGTGPQNLSYTDRIDTAAVDPFFDDLAQVPRQNLPILADFVVLLMADQVLKERGRAG